MARGDAGALRRLYERHEVQTFNLILATAGRPTTTTRWVCLSRESSAPTLGGATALLIVWELIARMVEQRAG